MSFFKRKQDVDAPSANNKCKASKENKKIEVNTQVLKGEFSLNELQQICRMVFDQKKYDEIILVGGETPETRGNDIYKMISNEISINVADGFCTNYLLYAKNETIVAIQVVISDSLEMTLSEQLNKNNNILRITE